MIKIKTIGQLLDYVETEEKALELIKYINQLQSNWNSLREWLISYRKNIENPDFYEEGIIDCIDEVLDKMNELEGVDNENNNV